MRKIIAGLLVAVFLAAGCSFSTSKQTTPEAVQKTSLLPGQIGGPTLTPFQPLLPTATPGPTNTPQPSATPTLLPTPTLVNSIHLGLPRPAGQINILIMGSDFRPGQGFRTDTLMVLSLNPEKGTASLVSFPRDLYVSIPGLGLSRINAAYPSGGFQSVVETFKDNFDITLDYYIMTNFNGFKSIVDTLGGINVYAGTDLYDKCDLPQAVDKYCYISAGANFMDGATALWYVRSRYTTNDFDRTRRAQEVLAALFQKAMSLDAVNRGAELYQLFITSVETNLDTATVLKILPFANQLIANQSLIKRFTIAPSNVINYIVPENGYMVLIPDPVSISEIIRQAFFQ